MSHALQYIDQAADEFFEWADSKFYNDEHGMWDDEHYYGNCTHCNSSPMARLQAAGHKCVIMGVEDRTLRANGHMDIDTGHDWLVVDDRWIVDIWAKFYDNFPKAVFDLQNPQDRAFIEHAYGPRDTWMTVYAETDDDDNESNSYWKNWSGRSHADWDEFDRTRPERVVEQLLDS